ncbi:DUF3592 domain-containing protein [Streptomyces sp. LaPpAH-108]|uniref:Rv1733c family protein n=1 Tax=Streptomyces sp. LaPpAH-108 TaxID=1155714 RepID=UPI00036ED706|nr:hypothetical protein [Streptomyces sp. LaPpAH-108]
MRTRVRGWRWRRNPLRRRSDVVEAWTVLLVAVLLCVVAPLAGVVAGLHAHDLAQSRATAQRAERHQVSAQVVGPVTDRSPLVHRDRGHTYSAEVRWTDPEGTTRTAQARVPAGTRTEDKVTVWFDRQGRSVAPPANDVAVWQHTVTVGLCAAGGTIAVALLARTVERRVALRRRLAEWDRDWARTGPEWSRFRA